MKKAIGKIFALIFVVILAVLPAGCNTQPAGVNPDKKPVEIPDTELIFTQNRSSPYVIVLPEGATGLEFAASELVLRVQEASGAELEIVYDNEINSADNIKMISLGNTKFFAASEIGTKDLGKQGYIVKRIDDDVYLAGNSDSAVLYAVYGFLEYQIGYKFYANDEVKVDISDKFLLKDFDFSDVPDFEGRATGIYELSTDATYRARLRLHSLYENWALSAHTYFIILPPAEYWKEHNTWYNPAATIDKVENLCLSAGEDMYAEFTSRVEEYLEANPQAEYVMLGQTDSFTFCDCEKCKAAVKELGTESALVIKFTNEIAGRVDTWLKENYPNREITYVAFAYNATYQAPANAEGGSYKPVVTAADNVGIMVVPMGANYQYGFFSEEANEAVAANYRAWKTVVGDNLFTWYYGMNFDDRLIPFGDWNSMGNNIKELKELGVRWIYNERGIEKTPVYDFSYLRAYLEGQMYRDSSLNMNDLVEDFMGNYYKDASEDMLRFYNGLRSWFDLSAKTSKRYSYSYGSNFSGSNAWPRELLYSWKRIFASAYEKIARYEQDDPEMYDKLFYRIQREELQIDYLLLRCYSSEFGNNYNSARSSFEMKSAYYNIYAFTF